MVCSVVSGVDAERCDRQVRTRVGAVDRHTAREGGGHGLRSRRQQLHALIGRGDGAADAYIGRPF